VYIGIMVVNMAVQ